MDTEAVRESVAAFGIQFSNKHKSVSARTRRSGAFNDDCITAFSSRASHDEVFFINQFCDADYLRHIWLLQTEKCEVMRKLCSYLYI